MSGTIALLGGGEFSPRCAELDRSLLAASGGTEVVVVPTAAAYEHPERSVDNARRYFAELGGTVVGLMALRRPDASDERILEAARRARFVYLTGGSPMHLRSVLKDTPLWDAIVAVHRSGGVVAASSAAAMAVTDPMVDPRGGAFTLGLGLVRQLTVIPQYETWSHERARRTFDLAQGFPVAALESTAAIVHRPDRGWRVTGGAAVAIYLNGHPAGVDVLPEPG